MGTPLKLDFGGVLWVVRLLQNSFTFSTASSLYGSRNYGSYLTFVGSLAMLPGDNFQFQALRCPRSHRSAFSCSSRLTDSRAGGLPPRSRIQRCALVPHRPIRATADAFRAGHRIESRSVEGSDPDPAALLVVDEERELAAIFGGNQN